MMHGIRICSLLASFPLVWLMACTDAVGGDTSSWLLSANATQISANATQTQETALTPQYRGQSSERHWYFRSDVVALKRDAHGDIPFATLDIGGRETVVLGTNHLDFPFQAGYRALLGRTLGENYRIDFSYMNLSDWNEIATVRNTTVNALGGNGDLTSRFTNFGHPAAVAGLDYNNLVSINYLSSLDNMELNLWHRMCMPPGRAAASVMIGGRYMNLMERLDYRAEADRPAPQGAINLATTATDNAILGLQIGGLFEYQATSCCTVDFAIKGAICQNQAGQVTAYTNIDENGASTAYQNGRAENGTTYLGDLSLILTYEFSPALTTHIGYRALFIDGVALASENVPRTLGELQSGPADLNDRGSIVYHGPTAGLTLMW